MEQCFEAVLLSKIFYLMKSSPKREEAGKRGILPALSMKKSFMLKRCLPCLRVLIYPKNVKNI